MKQLIFLLLLLTIHFFAPAQTTRKTINVADDLQLFRITDHAWVHVSVSEIAGFGSVSSNGVVFINKGEAFLFDTPVTDSLTEVLVRIISDSLKSKLVGFVPNHWHEDCMGGLKYLQSIGVESYANQITIEEANKRNLPVPSLGFTESQQLNLAGKSIECWYPGGGHTKDNIVVWLPDEKVLFAGCMVKEMKSKTLGNLADADIKSWPGTIEKLIEKYKNVEIVIPGHGLWGGPELLKHARELLTKNN